MTSNLESIVAIATAGAYWIIATLCALTRNLEDKIKELRERTCNSDM